VASVPQGVARPTRPRRKLPYLGPPSYNSTPRWGFPALAWRWPTTVPGTTKPGDQPITIDRVRAVSGHASAMLWTVAGLALLAGGGEIWRYVLLLQSRNGALSDSLVATSDAVVTVAAILAMAFAVLTVVVVFWWLHLARRVAAESAGRTLARSDRQVLVYLLIPGVNLAMAGVILAELENDVVRGQRPRPSRRLAVWWATWVGSGLLFTAAVLWRFRDGVQARADGVVLSALTDLAAVAVAILTALLIRRLTALLAPIDPQRARFMRVLKVSNAPEPPLREARAVPSRR
jgi:hypothetical protein